MIASVLILFLFITGYAAHSQLKQNPEAYNKASDKLANYYGSTIGKIFSDDLALEQEAEAEEAKEAKLKAEKEALDQKASRDYNRLL